MTKPHIIIIGGGVSGAALAIHLARMAESALRVTIVEPRERLGLGVAYSTPEPAHRINVPAARMSLFSEDKTHFERWLKRQPDFRKDSAALWRDGSAYPQRGLFGRYMEGLFADVAKSGPVQLRHLWDRAIGLQDNVVTTASGLALRADVVVLAVSHPPPALPEILRPWQTHPALVANPWLPGVLDTVEPTQRVGIMGTALTMADVVASLQTRGHRGPIVAFSRHGLLSRSNLSVDAPPPPWSLSLPWPTTARGALAQARREVAAAAEQGIPWQAVMDEIRANGQTLWQTLALKEQQRFLRHLRSWWDVHRYRTAPQVAQVIAARRESGDLRVLSARLCGVGADETTLTLRLQPRQGKVETTTVDKLIVTTGPAHASLTESQPLLHSLSQRGVLQPDPLGLGILVNERSETLDILGQPNPRLLVVGPAARGRFGELMGLPQVSQHAESVARHLMTSVIAAAVSARCPVST
ncbi:FAD/NAD(P)-binding protein [Lonsdalea quercina]|uniref:FAD/NAD(P)-binding protein n=1 Tax=Lonsdalea quercina TaxID=71657 RepID=UPI0039757F3B